MATHSNILAWEIPETEQLVGLQSMGLQEARVGHNLATKPPHCITYTILLVLTKNLNIRRPETIKLLL